MNYNTTTGTTVFADTINTVSTNFSYLINWSGVVDNLMKSEPVYEETPRSWLDRRVNEMRVKL